MALNEGEWSEPIAFYPHHITNHVEKANRRMLAQYQNKPVFAALIKACIGSPAQRQADLAFSLLELLDIDNAGTVVLDNIGRIVGQNRMGSTNDFYRSLIRARIARNTSRGRWQDIVNVFKLLTGSSVVHLTPVYPAGVLVQGDVAVNPVDLPYFTEFIEATLAAGVELVGIATIPTAGTFGFGPTSGRFSTDGFTDGGAFYV